MTIIVDDDPRPEPGGVFERSTRSYPPGTSRRSRLMAAFTRSSLPSSTGSSVIGKSSDIPKSTDSMLT